MTAFVIVASGLLTLALRAGFLVGGRPRWESRAAPYLQQMPASVLPALALSVMLGATAGPDVWARWGAAVLSVAVAWRSRSLLATMAVGMLSLWCLHALGV